MNSTLTCACGRRAGTGPVVVDREGGALCDRCIDRRYGSHHLAEIDQARACAAAAADNPRRHDPSQEWLNAHYRDFVQLVGVLPSVANGAFSHAFHEWLRAIDPEGLAVHWAALLGEDA